MTLLRSNITDLISRAENPEKMLNQLIIDMRGQLAKAKQQVASAIADEKRLAKQAHNPRFLKRVFTPEEVAYCSARRHSAQHYAVRFAAKEAVWKAIAPAIGRRVVLLRERVCLDASRLSGDDVDLAVHFGDGNLRPLEGHGAVQRPSRVLRLSVN